MTERTMIAVDPDRLAKLEEMMRDMKDMLDRVQMDPPKKYLSLAEYAEAIGRSKDTVRRRIKAGLIKTVDVGGEPMLLNPAAEQ